MTVRILTGDEKRREQNRLSRARSRARARGECIPRTKPGPAKGTKLDPAVVAARAVPRGEEHCRWTGDAVSEKGGRKRALKAYPSVGPCTRCGAKKAERHHRDGNTANNDPSNIAVLCRRCHMTVDGRLDVVREAMRARRQP